MHGVKIDTLAERDASSKEKTGSKVPADSKKSEDKQSARTYADLVRKCCYLCSRQFQSEAEVNKHERLSQLHQDNLKNEGLTSKAQAKMIKAGLASTTQNDTLEYRDRAKERRAAFGASKKTSLPLKKQPSQSAETNPVETNKADQDEDDDAAPVPSKGASLLGKMGWSAGEGLGAQGTGMVAPLTTDMYVQGVGLGAQGGKLGDAADEAERNTRGGYEEFLERTKDKAKERFERMG